MPKKLYNGKLIGLTPNCFKHHSKQFIDQDYIDELSEEDRVWLAKFNLEYYDCEFDEEPLHNTDSMKKDCYKRQNSGYRDVLNRQKVMDINEVPEPVEDFDEVNELIYEFEKRCSDNVSQRELNVIYEEIINGDY